VLVKQVSGSEPLALGAGSEEPQVFVQTSPRCFRWLPVSYFPLPKPQVYPLQWSCIGIATIMPTFTPAVFASGRIRISDPEV
jgi:hypothetical protein